MPAMADIGRSWMSVEVVDMLNIAMPKGRLGDRVYNMLKEAGYACPEMERPDRRLIFENPEVGVRYFWVKNERICRPALEKVACCDKISTYCRKLLR